MVVAKGAVDVVACAGHETRHTEGDGAPRRCGGQGDILSGIIATTLSWANAHIKVRNTTANPASLPVSGLFGTGGSRCKLSRHCAERNHAPRYTRGSITKLRSERRVLCRSMTCRQRPGQLCSWMQSLVPLRSCVLRKPKRTSNEGDRLSLVMSLASCTPLSASSGPQADVAGPCDTKATPKHQQTHMHDHDTSPPVDLPKGPAPSCRLVLGNQLGLEWCVL